jgi:putative ABC transport system ATP-binding protein
MELMREVAVAPNRACIVVTHDNRIFNFADRIIEMEDGKISAVMQGQAASFNKQITH